MTLILKKAIDLHSGALLPYTKSNQATFVQAISFQIMSTAHFGSNWMKLRFKKT